MLLKMMVMMPNRTLFSMIETSFPEVLSHYSIFLRPCQYDKVKAGILRIVLGYVSCGVIAIINEIKGIILGIKILKMTDEEFAEKKDTLFSGIPSGL